MTDTAPSLFTPPTRPRTWTVTMADGSSRTISASACRVEHGTVIFSEAGGMTVAMAAGTWTAVEMEPAP